ncbi:unnamed protein product [Strongylus vulgaris]|uniref:SMC hinge domain-containing protein n=1 Tax=Strongylus vulgaris TaxID=40348 RepID=A0A3P7J2C6_STRVU|nr:unnamed protein product [Strongylus vulgaris]
MCLRTGGSPSTFLGYRSKLKEIAAEVSTAEEKKKRILPELKKKKAEYEQMAKKNSAESSELKAREVEVKNYRVRVETLEQELAAISYNEEVDTKNRDTLATYQQEVHQMQIKLNILHQKNPRIHFTYKDPFVGFNRDDVRGCIATLFRIKDPKYALALEIAAGSFLSMQHLSEVQSFFFCGFVPKSFFIGGFLIPNMT